ncbi:MAG: D-alanyl-D-alanine carboxypeptidase family protein [Pyrinomonadaceae bacterium]
MSAPYYGQSSATSSATRQRVIGNQPAPSPTPVAPNPAQAVPSASTAVIITPLPVFNVVAAAAQNNRLKFNLNWTFGGKQQRGWYLYTALLNRELGIEREANTADFALALARWQQSNNLVPTGVLDADTWYQMIALWQARRIPETARIVPPASQLLTAPIIDFYDPTRAIELLKVERQTYAAYKRMVAAAAQDSSLKLVATSNGELSISEKYLKIISAFRSREYQEQLRRQSPNAGRAGLAVNSPHFTGRALDVYVGGDPVDTGDFNRAIQINTPVYKWLVKNAARFGFYPYYYEPWHWEYVPTNLPPTVNQ